MDYLQSSIFRKEAMMLPAGNSSRSAAQLNP